MFKIARGEFGQFTIWPMCVAFLCRIWSAMILSTMKLMAKTIEMAVIIITLGIVV